MREQPARQQHCRARYGLISSFLLAALSVASHAGQPPEPNLTNHIQPIFNAYCVVCHLEGGALGNLVLEEGYAFEQLVSRQSTQAPLKLVEPYQLDASYLIYKLEGKQLEAGGSGKAMPFDGTTLSDEEITVIKTWITEGAQEE